MPENVVVRIALAVVVGGLLFFAGWQSAQTAGAGVEHSIDLVAVLTDKDLVRRAKVLEVLRTEHLDRIAYLIRVVDEDQGTGPLSSRVLAARLLGGWHELSAIPALARHLDCKIPVLTDEAREFYIDGYPCGAAIAEMGPIALKPTLDAIAKQEEPMSPEAMRVAAYLIAALCDNSKEDAIAAIQKAGRQYPDSKNLHPIRMQIEEVMDFKENSQRQRAEPSA